MKHIPGYGVDTSAWRSKRIKNTKALGDPHCDLGDVSQICKATLGTVLVVF